MDCSVAGFFVNVAMIVVGVAGIVNVHVALVRVGHTAFQFVNVEPSSGIPTKLTCVPAVMLAVQPLFDPLLQLMPAPATVPVPVPTVCTVKSGVATALTVIAPEVPVIDPVTVSVAVIALLPTVFSVAENVPTPFVSVEFAGNTAAPSVLVKCTVPV